MLVIQVSSAGYMSGNVARVTINSELVPVDLNEHSHDRGLHIIVVNPDNGKVEMATAFDTYKTSYVFDAFIAKAMPDGYIVIAACKDDCVTKLSETAK